MAKNSEKPRRGRPPLADPAQVRDREIRVRVNEAEEAALIAAGRGNLSSWARDILLRAAKRAGR